jgi:transmembrane sensor
MRDGLRLMKLNGGRANLRVVSDKDGIFRIQTGRQAVVTQQSQIDVFDDSGTTSVTVIEGLASVETGHLGKDQKLALRGGERLRISGARLVRDRPNLSALMAWQRGQIVFDNSTLAQAAVDLNRYSDMKLVVEDPVVASWLVSGVFPVGDNRAFVRAASKFLPLGMIQMSNRILVVQAEHAKLG